MQSRKKLILPIVAGISLIIVGLIIVSGLILGVFLLNDPAGKTGQGFRIRTLAELDFESTATPVAYLAPAEGQDPAQPAPVESTDGVVQPQLDTAPQPASRPAGPVSATSPASTQPAAPAAVQPPATTGSVANSPLPTPTATATTATDAGSPTQTQTPTPTPSPTTTPATSPTPTATPSPTSTAPATGPTLITGRLLFDGVPASQGVKLTLEDQAYQQVAETTVGSDGVYRFDNVSPSSDGYNVLFSQEANPQYQVEQVISWGWLGPVAVADNATVNLPDLDIALLGLEPTQPAPNAAFSAAAVTGGNAINFEWSAYPQATKYWVDLAQGEEMELVWKSASIQSTSVAFNGQTQAGTIQPGEYWWGVGARRQLGDYALTVYGYVPVLLIDP